MDHRLAGLVVHASRFLRFVKLKRSISWNWHFKSGPNKTVTVITQRKKGNNSLCGKDVKSYVLGFYRNSQSLKCVSSVLDQWIDIFLNTHHNFMVIILIATYVDWIFFSCSKASSYWVFDGLSKKPCPQVADTGYRTYANSQTSTIDAQLVHETRINLFVWYSSSAEFRMFRGGYFALLVSAAIGLKIISTEERSCKVTTDRGKVDLSPLARSDGKHAA